MNELITIEELKKQIWEIDGIKVEITSKDPSYPERMVRPYTFDRLPNDATVDDLKERINKCLEPFIYIMHI